MLYEEVRVWKKLESSAAVRYLCLRDVSSGRCRVQSADFFRLPLTAEHVASMDVQAAELFIEVSSESVDDWHATIEAAIGSHEKTFAR